LPSIETYAADELPDERWAELVELNAEAIWQYPAGFSKNPHVRASLGIDDIDAYKDSKVNPAKEGQLYSDPLITLATDSKDRVLSFAWTADNTSGATDEIRTGKMNALVPRARWAWIGWVATRRDMQGAGLAGRTLATALKSYNILQPVSAYAWPSSSIGEMPTLHITFTRLGMNPTESKPPVIPDTSDQTAAIPTLRYTSRSVASSLVAAWRNDLTG
jgi:hypothetical protein